MSPTLILVAVVVFVILVLVLIYNGLVKAEIRTDEAWSDINVQLKRRYDLIPNLIEAVKGYVTHEKSVFENVTNARAAAMGATNAAGKAQAENMLTQSLKSLFAVAEAYPDLKASENFVKLQGELTDTEDKIQASRRFYNANVRSFNTKLQVFPANIIGKVMGFQAREFFATPDQEAIDSPVAVKF